METGRGVRPEYPVLEEVQDAQDDVEAAYESR